MKKIVWFITLGVIAAAVAMVALYSCGTVLRPYDGPPKRDTPSPLPHEGVFVCGSDTLTFFASDSIAWHFAEGAAEIGLSGKGSYAFTIDHHGLVDYDVANCFTIYLDENRCLDFDCPLDNRSTESTINLIRHDLGDDKEVTFEKVTI